VKLIFDSLLAFQRDLEARGRANRAMVAAKGTFDFEPSSIQSVCEHLFA
jgi:hypothetical protein